MGTMEVLWKELKAPAGYKKLTALQRRRLHEQAKKRGKVMSHDGVASYRFWSHNAKEKLALEASAAKYWSKRKPPKAVVEKRCAEIASKTLKRKYQDQGTFSGTSIMTIGTELTKGKKYLVKGPANAVDAAALINSTSKDVPECCRADGVAAVLSNRTKMYYALYTPGAREP